MLTCLMGRTLSSQGQSPTLAPVLPVPNGRALSQFGNWSDAIRVRPAQGPIGTSGKVTSRPKRLSLANETQENNSKPFSLSLMDRPSGW